MWNAEQGYLQITHARAGLKQVLETVETFWRRVNYERSRVRNNTASLTIDTLSVSRFTKAHLAVLSRGVPEARSSETASP